MNGETQVSHVEYIRFIFMKKFFVILALIGASVVYMLSRPTSGTTTVTSTTSSAGNTVTTVGSSASQAGATAPPTPTSYKNGVYAGSVADAYYGPIEVSATIRGGAISNVALMQSPSDQTSQYINSQVVPMLVQEVISAQSTNINTISGATFTSEAFLQSLASALGQAKG